MMTSPQYKEKELKIMRALMALLSSGMNISDIKTSDIADAAGIGKGTLYNYFKTKEEIISKTIIYSIEVELSEIFRRMSEAEGFRGKCYSILESVRKIIANENSDFHLMLFHVGGKEMQQFFGGDMSFIRKYLSMIFDQTMQLSRLGVREGLILPSEDTEYVYSAFAAALMSFVHARCRMEHEQPAAISAAMDNAYKLLLKALN